MIYTPYMVLVKFFTEKAQYAAAKVYPPGSGVIVRIFCGCPEVACIFREHPAAKKAF